MIHFTARGAVATPETLQIRIGAVAGGALRAGAPTPSRSLRLTEVRANLEHFTTGLITPRTRPCTRLVLSGVRIADDGLVQEVERARTLGIASVLVHGSAGAAVLAAADGVAVRCDSVLAVRQRPHHQNWTALVPLTAQVLTNSDALVAELIAARPERVVLSWPFPGVEVLPVHATIPHAQRMLSGVHAAGLEAVLRGLPPCLSGSPHGRTRNRYYVDADHQRSQALLFWPDVVQFLKPDICRSCAKTDVCDGVAAEWWERGVVPAVHPI